MSIDFYSQHVAHLDQLRAGYPNQFSGEHIDWCWPDGWHALVAGVCAQAAIVAPATQWVQIKEKFGGLRMYRSGGPLYLDLHSGSGVRMLRKIGVIDELEAVIDAALHASLSTCMYCGAPAQRCRHDGWLLTLCGPCREALGSSVDGGAQ